MTPSRRPPGELEAHILRVLWDSPRPLTAKDIGGHIPPPTPAQTTVLTALDRLSAKGLVKRAGDELRGIRFLPAHTEEEHISRAMLSRLGSSSDREAALLHFAGNLNDEDLKVLRRVVDDKSQD